MNTPCSKCGLPLHYDDPEEVPIRHASSGECVKALRADRARLTTEIAALRVDRDMAIARIKDMLMDDDGQAWKEARKFIAARRAGEEPPR